MRYYCLQHIDFETPGLIASWVPGLAVCRAWSEALPALSDFDVLVIMGGPMSVHDDLPWLRAEKELIRSAILAGKRVLGVCLGAQLIAEVMGGRVFSNPVKEIGWWPVRWFEGGEEEVFHWHGETFDLPPGAELLASSEGCVNQAFRVGENVLGVQFHPEVTEDIVRDMVRFEGHELTEDGPFIQNEEEVLLGVIEPGYGEAAGESIGASLLKRFLTV